MLGIHQLKVDDLLIDETVYCTHTHMKVHIKYCPLNLLPLILTHEHMHEHMHASTDTVT